MKYLRNFETGLEAQSFIENFNGSYSVLLSCDEIPIPLIIIGEEPTPIDYSIPFYIENITDEDEVVDLTLLRTNRGDYSYDNSVWNDIESNSITLEPGDKVYLRGELYTGSYNDHIYGMSKIGGNIMSLHKGGEFTGDERVLENDEIFAYLFSESNVSTTLLDASELILPVTTLTDYCYQYMFNWCSALTAAPVLPATTLANSCYRGMFNGCSALTSAPALPATTLAESCYDRMFTSSGLISIPNLPATILSDYCYYAMFASCSSLTGSPVFRAEKENEGVSCYWEMFAHCENLSSYPVPTDWNYNDIYSDHPE